MPFLAVAVVVVLLLLRGSTARSTDVPASRARDALPAPAVACAVEEDAPADPEGATITGTVVDERARPFAGARVRIFPGSDPGRWSETVPALDHPAASVETGPDGRFRLPALEGTAALVVADAPDRVAAVATVRSGVESIGPALALVPGTQERIRVTDEQGRPIASAEALVFQQGETLRMRVAADEEGWIEACLAKRELLVVRAPGFAWELVDPPVTPPLVVLEREYRVGGIVRLADGRPVHGARIEFDRYLWREEITTGADGRFLAGGFGEGELDLLVTLRESDTERVDQDITVQPGDEAIDIVFGTASVDGVVLLADGRPAAGASVSGGSGGRCDSAGRFVLREVDPGDRTLWASQENLSGSTTVVVGATDIHGVTIVLEAPSQLATRSVIHVSAVDPNGAPVAAGGRIREGDDCSWWSVGPGGGDVRVLEPPGTAVHLFGRAEASKPGELGASAAVDAVVGGPEVTLRLRPPLAVTILCAGPDGVPLDTATIELSDISDVPLRPDGSGRAKYLFHADEPDSATLLLLAPGYAPTHIRDWKPPANGGEVVFPLQPAIRITGQAFDPDPGSTEHVRVQLIGETSFESQDAAGRFRFDAVPGATVTVVASKGGMPGFAKAIDLPAKGAVDLGAVRLDKPWVVNGSVVDRAGAPVGGAVVTVLGPAYERRAATRGDGTFRISLPPSDLYSVTVEKDALEAGPFAPSVLLSRAEPIRLSGGR